MSEIIITPAEIHEAADCVPSTLRAWHNRVGFLPRSETGWRKYSMADLVSVRLMVILTSVGLKAQDSVQIVHAMIPSITDAVERKAFSRVIVSKTRLTNQWHVRAIGKFDCAGELGFGGEVAFLLNINNIYYEMDAAIKAIRGTPDDLSSLREVIKQCVTGPQNQNEEEG